MDALNILNILLYMLMIALCVVFARRKLWTPFVIIGSLALHGMVFNAVYIYRDLFWVSCPPLCGLQEWSPVLRMHALFAIVMGMIDRLYVSGRA